MESILFQNQVRENNPSLFMSMKTIKESSSKNSSISNTSPISKEMKTALTSLDLSTPQAINL